MLLLNKKFIMKKDLLRFKEWNTEKKDLRKSGEWSTERNLERLSTERSLEKLSTEKNLEKLSTGRKLRLTTELLMKPIPTRNLVAVLDLLPVSVVFSVY